MVLFTKHHSTFMSSETISENKLTSIASIKSSNDVDLVRSYLRDIGRVPLLSHEQEITLGRQVQEYMEVERRFVNNTIKKCKVKQKNPQFYKNENKYLVNLS